MDTLEAWDFIVDWCTANAPSTAASIGQPNSAADVARVESAFPRKWPGDLRTWYTLADGAERSPSGHLIPGYRPLTLAEVASSADQWRSTREAIVTDARQRSADSVFAQFRSDQPDPYDIDLLEAARAGESASLFLPSFVPIAEDRAGAYLFVDLRDGDLHGCVTAYLKGDGDAQGPLWSSVTAMLSEVADSLANGTSLRNCRRQSVDGRLDWDFDFAALGL